MGPKASIGMDDIRPDLTDRHIHVQTQRTRLVRDEVVDTISTDDLISYNLTDHASHTAANTGAEYEVVRCPNTLNFQESFTETGNARNPAEDIYYETQKDDVAAYQSMIPSLSR